MKETFTHLHGLVNDFYEQGHLELNNEDAAMIRKAADKLEELQNENLSDNKITIVIRDINGKRDVITFDNESSVLDWVNSDGLWEEYEILIVSQGNFCLFSALSSANALTIDDLTGFFG
jgi:C4-type Zn-finger protein